MVHKNKRPKVYDLGALKGAGTLSMLCVPTPEEAAAMSVAGIDMLSIINPDWDETMREAVGQCFVQVGLLYGVLVTTKDYLRTAHRAQRVGGDAFYRASRPKTIMVMAEEGLPVVGHVGLVSSRNTWTGGFGAAGKAVDQALMVWKQPQQFEKLGAFAYKLEVVSARAGTELSTRSTLLTFGMGAGSGADAQYLFAEDVFGFTEGHMPRHPKTYRDFAKEYTRLQSKPIAAFQELEADVDEGVYLTLEHDVAIVDDEFEIFMGALGR